MQFACIRATRFALAVALLLSIFSWASSAAAAENAVGAVFALTNAAGSNAVVMWQRSLDGRLNSAGSFATGGAGNGAGLGSQGAVILSANHQLLFAVNAGSNDISTFRIGKGG